MGCELCNLVGGGVEWPCCAGHVLVLLHHSRFLNGGMCLPRLLSSCWQFLLRLRVRPLACLPQAGVPPKCAAPPLAEERLATAQGGLQGGTESCAGSCAGRWQQEEALIGGAGQPQWAPSQSPHVPSSACKPLQKLAHARWTLAMVMLGTLPCCNKRLAVSQRQMGPSQPCMLHYRVCTQL